MKALNFSLLVLIIAVFLNTSCKKEEILAPILLTNEVKSEFSKAADKVFLETATPGLFALVSVEGEPDFIIKRGMGNLLTAEPMNNNNAFRIGSVTKTFTGTAVLMLVDEGLIDLDASIASYLPEYNIPSGDAITIRMLGNMTSGLFNYSTDPGLWESFIASGYTQFFPPDSLLAIAFRYPLNFAPGTSYEYCNTNTVLLGLLLEKITGKPAYQVITDKVVLPLNLTNTYFGGPFFMNEPYSKGYSFQEEGLVDATNWNPSWGYTAGAMISTPEDMKKWVRHLADGDLLSENMKAELFNFGSNNYGFCVESINYKNDHWIGHPGVIPGYNTQVWYNSDRNITMVINSNTEDNYPAQTLMIAYVLILGDL
jgi:D-alanyl-D-alanine carboxypeptidase